MTETTTSEPSASGIQFHDKAEGPISAAIIAAGIGAFALGIFTTLAEASAGAKGWFEWSVRVGPLSGKTTMAVIVWLVAWVVLHFTMRRSRSESSGALIVSLVLIGLGIVGTFPTFFQAFAPE